VIRLSFMYVIPEDKIEGTIGAVSYSTHKKLLANLVSILIG